MAPDQMTFDHLLIEATQQGFQGWDFSAIAGRWHTAALPWDYRQSVQVKGRPARR